MWQVSQKLINVEILIRHEDLKKFSKRRKIAARLFKDQGKLKLIKRKKKCFFLILFLSTDSLKETEVLTKQNKKKPSDYLPLCTGVLLTTKTALTSGSCIEQAQKDGDRSQDIGVWDRISSLQVTNIILK